MRMRSSLVIFNIVAGLALLPSAYGQSKTEVLDLNSPRTVHIATQSLEDALVALSKQGSFQLLIAAGSLPTRSIGSIDGSVSIREALDKILQDTGLSYRSLGNRTIAITCDKYQSG